jgi:hypothetical protein
VFDPSNEELCKILAILENNDHCIVIITLCWNNSLDMPFVEAVVKRAKRIIPVRSVL